MGVVEGAARGSKGRGDTLLRVQYPLERLSRAPAVVRQDIQTLLSILVPILWQLVPLHVVWRQKRRDLTRLCTVFRKSSLFSQTIRIAGRLDVSHAGGSVLGHAFEPGARGGEVTTVG